MARTFAVKAVHKQMFPASENFRGDANDALPSGWTDNDGADCATTVIASLDGHKKVVEFYDQSNVAACNILLDFGDPLADDVHEFWMGKNSIAANTNFVISFYEGGTSIITIGLIEDDAKAYHTGAWNVVKAACLSANTLIHIKIIPDDSANTFDFYINGVLEGDNVPYRNNSAVGIEIVSIYTDNADINYKGYIDAWGTPTRDANYKIGDNCFWRHYKESTDSFEGDDVGTQGISITWLDSVNTADDHEIIAEFNEHKKILRTYQNSGTGDGFHTFASQGTAGWIEGWVKVADADAINNFAYLREGVNAKIWVRIDNDRFEYDAGAGMVDVGCPAIDATWYHFFLQWYADNTFDLWVNNVQYLDGVSTFANFAGTGISQWYVDQDTAGAKYIDLGAPMSILDGDTKADNRIFDYNSTYTSEDITTTITNVITENKFGGWRTGTMYSKTSYENSEIFVQVYDINSKLGIEADLKRRNQVEGGMKYEYPLRDKNQDDLEHESSNAFTADAIHDPTDSTSMLKVILPNVGEADGDLILVDADIKATTYSPTTIRYPDYKMLLDIGDLADSVVIVHADGKCYMSDAKASGTVLDVDTAADFDKMTKPVLVSDILEEVNYLEIKGAINPETGVRFYKIIDNTGSDKKRSWRYTNDQFKSQADVDAYAAALESKVITAKLIKIEAQSIGEHNMGETMDYKYVKAPYNVPQANYYILYERIDYDQNENIIIMSEGMIEDSKYAAGFERSETDPYASGIYATDKVTINLSLYPGSGAAFDSNGITTIKDQRAHMRLYTSAIIDEDRDLTLDFVFRNGLHGARTTDGALTIVKWDTDGSANSVVIENNLNFDAVFTANSGFYHKSYTLSSSDLEADHMYYMNWENEETDNGNATTCRVASVHATYYIKRLI